ncbi:MAG: FAD assembly factor SdhE [Gammaproteobacteria bacterium]
MPERPEPRQGDCGDQETHGFAVDLTATRIQKAKWRSRRGMRELDVLLMAYIDAHCSTLTERQWQLFEALLAENDMDLYGWFTGRNEPSNPDYAVLVATICASSRL